MGTTEIIIKLVLGGGFLLNGVTGIITRRTQFGVSTGWSHVWGFPVNFVGEAAFVFTGTLLLCGSMIGGQPLVELLAPENGFARNTRSVLTTLSFVFLFLGLVASAVIQFATSLGQSYRATMDRDSKSKREPDEHEVEDQR